MEGTDHLRVEFAQELFEYCVFRPCSYEDGYVGVGVLPETKKILIRGARLNAFSGCGERAGQSEVGQSANG